jgi:ribosomal-protein-alanine N-acetyltransferase
MRPGAKEKPDIELLWAGRRERDFVQLTEDHLERILEIERVSFANPWSAEDFHRAVYDHSAFCKGVEVSEELRGYAVGYAIGTEFHLANFAIAPAHRRQGWASDLLQYLIAQACQMGCRECTLEVRPSNFAAVAFYKMHRFQPVGVYPRYYENPRENALIMKRCIVEI